jgi:PKD repeat protein
MLKKVLVILVLVLLASSLMPAAIAVAQEGDEYWITLLDTTVVYKEGHDTDLDWEDTCSQGPWEFEVPQVDGWIDSTCEMLTDTGGTTRRGGLTIEYFDSGGESKPWLREIVNGGRIEATHYCRLGGTFFLWRGYQEWQMKIYFIPAVTVPDVKGLSRGEAEAKIAEAQLRVGDVYEGGQSGVPKGIVYSTDPKAGKVVKAGSEVDIDLAGNNSPRCSFEVRPEKPTSDDLIQCVSTSTDVDNDPLTYQWYLDKKPVGSESSISLGKLEPGIYVVQLAVNDGTIEIKCKSQAITVTRTNQPPECSFTINPSSPTSDDPIICFSTSTDPDGDPLYCEWNLDGGYAGSDCDIELGKLLPGKHAITLNVNDGNEGTDECSQTITVSAKPSNGGGMGCERNGDKQPDDGGSLDIEGPISTVKVTYLGAGGDAVSEVGTLVDPCNPNSISLDVRDSRGNIMHTSTIPTGNLLRYDMTSEIHAGQLYPAQFYIPFRPTSVITPNVDFSIKFVRDEPRPKNIMFAGGSEITPNPSGMSEDGWYHFFVSGSEGTVGELSIIFTPGGAGGGGAGGGGTGQRFDISPLLLGMVFVPLVITKCWRRRRK